MMMGKVTRVSAEEYAVRHGLDPVQIDGIPEGFSFKTPTKQIGDTFVDSEFIALIPLAYWSDHHSVKARDEVELVYLYKKQKKPK